MLKKSVNKAPNSKGKNESLLNSSARLTYKQPSNIVRSSSNSSLNSKENLSQSTSRYKAIAQKNQNQKSLIKNTPNVAKALSKSKEVEKENLKPSYLNIQTQSKATDIKRKGTTVSGIRNNLVKGQHNTTIIRNEVPNNSVMINNSTNKNIKKNPLKQIETLEQLNNFKKKQEQITIKLSTPRSHMSQVQEQNSILKYIPPQIWTQHKKVSSNDFYFISTIQAHSYFKDVLAMHLTLNALFNVRIIDKMSVQKQQLKQQLIQSIKIQLYLSNFNLPHLLTLYTIFQDANSVYLVMEPLLLAKQDQENLTEYVSSQGKTNQNIISLHCKQIAQTINKFHKLKIIARDLNVEFLKVQMGISKITLVDCAASLSKRLRRQSFLGDVQKIPQQLAQGKSYNHLYDSWSLGIILYILGTRVKPFSGSKSFRQIQQINYLLPMNISKQLTDLIFRLLNQQSERLTIDQALQHPFFTFGTKQKNMVSKDLWAFWEFKN